MMMILKVYTFVSLNTLSKAVHLSTNTYQNFPANLSALFSSSKVARGGISQRSNAPAKTASIIGAVAGLTHEIAQVAQLGLASLS